MKNQLLLTAAAVFVTLGSISTAEAGHKMRHHMIHQMDKSGVIGSKAVDRESVCCNHASSCRMDLHYKYRH